MKKPVILISCLVSMFGGALAAEKKGEVEAVEEIEVVPENGISGRVWRLTADPLKGHFLVAKVQEFGNIKSPGKDQKPLRETTRIIWTGGGSWTEDIIWTYYLKGPRMKESDPYSTRSILSGFGQQFDMGTMFLNGSGGGSVNSSVVGEKPEGAMNIRRRFNFANDRTSPTVWNTVYFIVASTERMEVISLAMGRGVKLPEAGERPWSITLPPSTEEITADSAPEKK